MIWNEGRVSTMVICRDCTDGEVERVFFLSGPRSIEKRTFHLPCPTCRPQDYKASLSRLRESLRQWELTISHEEVRTAHRAQGVYEAPRDELGPDGDARSTSISI